MNKGFFGIFLLILLVLNSLSFAATETRDRPGDPNLTCAEQGGGIVGENQFCPDIYIEAKEDRCCKVAPLERLADIMVSDFSVGGKKEVLVDEGKGLIFTATLKNIGRKETNGFEVALRRGSEGGELISTQIVQTIDQGEETIVNFTIPFQKLGLEGTNNYYVYADVKNEVKELDEKNNVASVKLILNATTKAEETTAQAPTTTATEEPATTQTQTTTEAQKTKPTTGYLTLQLPTSAISSVLGVLIAIGVFFVGLRAFFSRYTMKITVMKRLPKNPLNPRL
jgi:hypothetical protein